MCNLVGYDVDTLLTMSWQQLTAPDDVPGDTEAIAELVAGRRESYRTRKRYLRADGRVIWCDESVGSLRRGEREAKHLVSQIIDITEEVEAQDELARQGQRNRALAERLRAELDSAARYVASILPGDLPGPVHVTSRYLPSLEIVGDSYNYSWIRDDQLGDHLIVYLIDVSGHGVEPALVSMSVHNLLRSGSLSRTTLLSPDRVLAELNRLFDMERHGGNYSTIWYGVYQTSTRTLSYASAGHPPAIALTGTTATLLPAQSMPLGMFGDAEFSTTVHPIPPGCQLLLYSDGAFEFTRADGRIHTLGEFLALCSTTADDPDWSLDDLLGTLLQRTATGAFEDDCALIRLHFD